MPTTYKMYHDDPHTNIWDTTLEGYEISCIKALRGLTEMDIAQAKVLLETAAENGSIVTVDVINPNNSDFDTLIHAGFCFAEVSSTSNQSETVTTVSTKYLKDALISAIDLAHKEASKELFQLWINSLK